jgi:hypothetical protein
VSLVGLLVVANTINIAADVAAMAEASSCWSAGRSRSTCSRSARLHRDADLLLVRAHGARPQVADARPVRLRRRRSRRLGAVGAGDRRIGPAVGLPARGDDGKEYAAMVVAVLGTTISPYLFFWQATQEVEDCRRRPEGQRLRRHPAYVRKHLRRIKLDTIVGMGFSNLVALCIVVATAVTLNQRGVVNIQTAAQAAEALRPVAGAFAFLVFGLGIIGTGCSRCRCSRARRRTR